MQQKKKLTFNSGMLHRINVSLLSGLLSLIFIVSACKKDDDDPVLGPVPSITVNPATASGTVGTEITATATIDAPEGLKSLTVLKNGAVLETKTYNNEKTATYELKYTIENLPVGSVVTFTMQATDSKDRPSTLQSVAVTIGAVAAKQIVEVAQGNLTGEISWTKDKIYRLNGFVRVGTDPTVDGQPTAMGTLTIQEGTIIIGDRETKGTLIIQRGSKIIANGTKEEPIIFTSEREPSLREPGDWGGLVICGKATNNNPGGVAQLEGGYGGYHGGTDDADNSGSLKFVRIEFAGVPINPNQEVNSLTLGSVGSGTVIENVMASYGLDDSFEWFGGTVNAKYLIAYRGLDDDFDVDNGFRGNVQYGLGIRGATLADQSGSNGFEVDNDGGGTAATPFTAAVFSNVTELGPKANNTVSINVQFQNGMHLRRNAQIKILNSFFAGYPNGLYIDPSGGTNTNALNGSLVLRNVVLAGVEGWGTNGFGGGTTVNPRGFPVRDETTATPPVAILIGAQTPSAWFAAQPGNEILPKWQDAGIDPSAFTTGTKPTLLPAAGSSLLTGGDVTGYAGLEATTFKGAFGATDWTDGWAQWNPQAPTYR